MADPALEELGEVEEDGEEGDRHDVGGQAPAVRARVSGHATVLHWLVHRAVPEIRVEFSYNQPVMITSQEVNINC